MPDNALHEITAVRCRRSAPTANEENGTKNDKEESERTEADKNQDLYGDLNNLAKILAEPIEQQRKDRNKQGNADGQDGLKVRLKNLPNSLAPQFSKGV